MLEDEYDQEKTQERRHMLKGAFLKMKAWYLSAECVDLRAKYGADTFPSFWQDLETWSHTKVILKLFLIVCERKEGGGAPTSEDIMALEASIAAPKSVQETAENDMKDSTGVAKKRRNRWGEGEGAEGLQHEEEQKSGKGELNPPPSTSIPDTSAASTADGGDAAATKKSRRSRWGGDALTGIAALSSSSSATITNSSSSVAQPISQEVLQQTMVLKIQLQQLNDRLLNVVQEAAVLEQDPNRPPSPAPKYDKDGKRTNTREVRLREELTKERAKLIEELVKLNPLFQPPADAIKTKPTRRVYIPFREFPTYNFFGLIIGPRGNTQKKMEQETGCKISIRGKGSIKEGSKGRSSQNETSTENEDLHVVITGDTDESVDMAVKMVEELLRPIDDDKNDHKQKQLRELALINGTLRDEEFCPACGEKGHRQFECPHRAKTFKTSGVKCSICGDLSHPTRDCPMKKDDPTNASALESEYNSFIAELDGKSAKSSDGEAFCQPVTTSESNTSRSQQQQQFSSTSDVVGEQQQQQTAARRQQTVIHMPTFMTGAPLPHIGAAPTNPMWAAAPAQGYDPSAAAWHGGPYAYGQPVPGQMPMDYSQHMQYGQMAGYQHASYAPASWGQHAPPPPPPDVPPPPPPDIPPPPPF
jgi:splicing factor 1